MKKIKSKVISHYVEDIDTQQDIGFQSIDTLIKRTGSTESLYRVFYKFVFHRDLLQYDDKVEVSVFVAEGECIGQKIHKANHRLSKKKK